jgi:hypothetical protein
MGIGGLQILANGLLLLRGFTRLPRELATEGATTRLAVLLRAAWAYGMLGNLCLGVVLILIAPGLQAGEPLPRRIATTVGAFYALAGGVTYAFTPGRHAGLLGFSAMGMVLLVPLWLSR